MSQADDNYYRDDVPPVPQQPQMSGCMKIFLVLLVVGAIGGVICCGGLVFFGWNFAKILQNAMSTDPAEIQKTTQEIVDITIPPEYTPQMRVDLSFAKFVVYGDTTKEASLTIAQIAGTNQAQPGATGIEEFRKEQNKGAGNAELTEVTRETKSLTVRGAKRDFIFVELKAPMGEQKYRRISGAFPGKQGQAEIQLQLREEDYDEDKVTELLESIK